MPATAHNEDRTSSLRQTAVSGLKWNYLGQGVRTACSLIIGIVLARLLGPKPFGQVAIAMLLIGVGSQMADVGLSSALVQSQAISDRDVRFGFSAQVLFGTLLTCACMLLARPVAQIFHQPEVAPVLMALALVFLLQALGQTAAGLLRRQLAFRPVQIAEIVSYVIGYVGVGIPLAYGGYGVWALVGGQLCQTTANSAMLYLSRPHPLRPSLRHDSSMVSFGVKVIATNMVNWVIANLDTALAGHLFPVFQLGLYNRALNLAIAPVNTGMSALQGVLFPACSRAPDRRSVASAYLGCLAVLGAVVIPAYAAVAAAASTVISTLYGSPWSGAAPLLAVFAVAAPLRAGLALAGPALWGLDKVERELRVEAIVAFAAMLVFPLAARISLRALAIGVASICALRFLLITRAALELLHIPWRKVAHAVRGGLVLAAIMAAVVSQTDTFLSVHGAGAIMRLAVDASLAAILQVSALLLAPSAVLGAQAVGILDSLRGSMPRCLQFVLPRTVPAHGLEG